MRSWPHTGYEQAARTRLRFISSIRKTRKELPDQLPHGDYFGLAIEPDKRGVYYSRDDSRRGRAYFIT